LLDTHLFEKGFAGYATRFVDPAMGFALGMFVYILMHPGANPVLVLGWNYLMKYVGSA